MFEHEYDLQSLELIVPKGRTFFMYITPRYRHHYIFHEYEKTTANFLVRLLASADLFIDAGAHFGYFSMLVAGAHPSLPIIALEPTPVTYEILRRNIALGGHAKIVARQVALSSGEGHEQGFFVSAASENSGLYEHPDAPPIGRIEVKTLSIDTLLKDHPARKIVVKIDAESHEFAILAGMSESLRRGLDIRMMVGFNPAKLRQAGQEASALLRELDRLGFAMFVLEESSGRFCRISPQDDAHPVFRRTGYANIYCVAKERALSVVFFSHSHELAGAERSLLELVDELIADHGAVCSVVAPAQGALLENVSALGAAPIVADLPWWAFVDESQRDITRNGLVRGSEAICRKLVPLLTTIDPDIVYTQTLVIPWGALAAAMLGKPHVWSICEYGELDHGLRFVDPIEDIVVDIERGSSQILTVSNGVRNTLFPDIDPDRIHTAYRHIAIPDDVAPSPAAWRRAESFKIGLFGSFLRGKGQLEAVKSVVELVKRARDVELLLAGYIADKAYHAEVVALIESQGLRDRVTITGFLKGVYPTMAAADAVLNCARSEAFGRSIVEAMLLGRPIVSARSGGVFEYLDERRTGLAYEAGNVDELVNRVEELIEDRDRAAEMGRLAKESARQKFTRDAYGGAVFRLMTRLRGTPSAIAIPRSVSTAMAKAINEYGVDVDERELLLTQRDTEFASLRSRIASDEALLAQRDAEARELENRSAKADALLAQREAGIGDLRRRLAAREADAAALHATVTELTESTSWRVTAPLRGLKRFIQRRRNRSE